MGSQDPACIFCKIVRREAPASIVDEDELTLSFLDIQPINPGHVLVVPKEHAASLADLRPSAGGRMFERAMAIAKMLRGSELRCEGVNFHLADGKAAGQEVFHVHLHVIPRYMGDGFGFRRGPQSGRRADRDGLDAIATRLRAARVGH